MNICHVCMGAHRGQKRLIKSPGVGVTGSCEPPNVGCLEVTSGPLQEQSMLVITEPSFQSRRSVSAPILCDLSPSVTSHPEVCSCSLSKQPMGPWALCPHPLPTQSSSSLIMPQTLSPEPIISQLAVLPERSFTHPRATGPRLSPSSALQLPLLTLT